MTDYTALSLFGAAKCTLECSYCYIKKTEDVKQMDEDIVKWLHDPVVSDKIDTTKINTITIWGGEPTLHLDVIVKNLKKYKKLFPNLKNFSTSSNMSFSKHYDVFAKMLSENNYSLDLQISDDSGLFNKENRGISSDVIQNNTIKFLSALKKYGCKFHYHFKATTSIENFELLYEDDNALFEYFNYFEKFAEKISNVVGESFKPMATSATIVCPGAYTTKDGIIFSSYLHKVVKWINEGKFKDFKYTVVTLNYPERWTRNVTIMDKFSNEQHMFTCSAGDSNIQVDSLTGIHPCHRSLFFVYDAHLKNLKNFDISHNDDVDYLNSGLIDVYRKYYSQDHDIIKTHMRSFHDHFKHRIATATATIMEAAKCGQVSEVYMRYEWAQMLAFFVQSCSGCPVENFFVTSSWHLSPLSIIRIFGNGAFELIHKILWNGMMGTKEISCKN